MLYKNVSVAAQIVALVCME